MCQPQPGLRCANHLTKEISKLENKENLSPEETSELRKLKVSYFGTRTGQQELDQKISIAEAAGSTSKAYSLNQLKEKARNLREQEKTAAEAQAAEQAAEAELNQRKSDPEAVQEAMAPVRDIYGRVFHHKDGDSIDLRLKQLLTTDANTLRESGNLQSHSTVGETFRNTLWGYGGGGVSADVTRRVFASLGRADETDPDWC